MGSNPILAAMKEYIKLKYIVKAMERDMEREDMKDEPRSSINIHQLTAKRRGYGDSAWEKAGKVKRNGRAKPISDAQARRIGLH